MKPSLRLLIIAVLFATALITANVMAVKIMLVGPVELPAAVLVFPLSYILGDVLTEVYGYQWARRIIWLGFGCNLIFVLFTWLGGLLPPAPTWGMQSAYEDILGYIPRLLLASLSAYVVGMFSNSFIMAKMKLLTRGRWLWSRTIGSTVIGEGLDSTIFITLAYLGSPVFAPSLILAHWITKVVIEIIATPLIYSAVNMLKKAEGVEVYDYHTNFNPFVLN